MKMATRSLLEEQIAVVVVLESGTCQMPCGMCHKRISINVTAAAGNLSS